MPFEIKRRPSAFAEPPEHVKDLLVRSASNDISVARDAQHEQAKALEEVLRKGILTGDVIYSAGIFEPIRLVNNAAPEFPLDIVAPGTEREHRAYTIPMHGRIPERTIEGDYVMITTYEVGSSIDWPLKLAANARWDIVGRALEVFEAGFVKKANDDGFQTLLAAAADRNIVVYDTNAGVGRFTLRLISLMQQAMRRNAGGNSASVGRGRLTDMFLSIEALEDMRNWTIADVNEATRQQIFNSAEGYISRIFDVNLQDLYEFGAGQEYQNFFLDPNGLNASLAPSDVELVLGLDLQRNDSFVNPIKAELEVFEDDNMHRMRRAGVYGWAEHGFGVLDNRRIILGSM
jgi:hypothetical protein